MILSPSRLNPMRCCWRLKKAEERESLRRENRRLKDEIKEIQHTGSFPKMVGESAAHAQGVWPGRPGCRI